MTEPELLAAYGFPPPAAQPGPRPSESAHLPLQGWLEYVGTTRPPHALLPGVALGHRRRRYAERMAVFVPWPAAADPWAAWLAGRGWHVHRIGAAMYAHPSDDQAAGWLVAFLPSRPNPYRAGGTPA